MSFNALDSSEFPPLDRNTQSVVKPIKVIKDDSQRQLEEIDFKLYKNYPKKIRREEESEKLNGILISNDFVAGRVGYGLMNYEEDLDNIIRTNRIGECGDFILAPIAPTRQNLHERDFNPLPDLTLPYETWRDRVAIDLGDPPCDMPSIRSIKNFDKLFRHALYLPSHVITINCPESDFGFVNLASIINERLLDCRNKRCDEPMVLLKLPIDRKDGDSNSSWGSGASPISSSSDLKSTFNHNDQCFPVNQSAPGSSAGSNGESGFDVSDNVQDSDVSRDCWKDWNAIRSHLIPDIRLGVCLVINNELLSKDEELERWIGEPIRMIIIPSDQFTQSTHNGPVCLNSHLKTFITKVALANSLKISFVIGAQRNQNLREHLSYLEYFSSRLREENRDRLRVWNDTIQTPLQPLSSNLDSGTYGIFEMDSMKYIKYREAMQEALQDLISRLKMEEVNREIILMVLGAGRGPLVESFIRAIQSIQTDFKIKLFALDKNSSSVLSLKYKQKNTWVENKGLEIEVVESDMRTWNPNVKADIIATELLGSLSDNELSPECIDGVWRFSTPSTISIPQEYSSYIAPICSYKIHQALWKLGSVESHVYDQIYVCRLTNCYHIDEPKALFKFEHLNLSLNPDERCNERYIELSFTSKVDSVCHGFAGYFTANLFGTTNISTLYNRKTNNMDSWFPAFIPLENPVTMSKGSRLDVHFWRKESATNVWYQWVITNPARSRIYSQNGINSAMSKLI